MTGTRPSGDEVERSGIAEWRPGPGDTVVAETATMRLIVCSPSAAGCVRFLVTRRPETPGDHCALPTSGSKASVQAAMRGAERTAAGLASRRPSPAVPSPGAAAVPMRPGSQLSGRRVLVVENEWVIAHDLELAFRRQGAEVAGPVPSVAEAQALLATGADLDGAVLDVNLGGHLVYQLADALAQSGVPFVFATGYSAESIPERYAHVPRCYKPISADAVARALGHQLSEN